MMRYSATAMTAVVADLDELADDARPTASPGAGAGARAGGRVRPSWDALGYPAARPSSGVRAPAERGRELPQVGGRRPRSPSPPNSSSAAARWVGDRASRRTARTGQRRRRPARRAASHHRDEVPAPQVVAAVGRGHRAPPNSQACGPSAATAYRRRAPGVGAGQPRPACRRRVERPAVAQRRHARSSGRRTAGAGRPATRGSRGGSAPRARRRSAGVSTAQRPVAGFHARVSPKRPDAVNPWLIQSRPSGPTAAQVP